MSDREEIGFGGKLYHLIKRSDLRFMCALRSHQRCCLGHANRAKCRLSGLDFVRLEWQLAQAIHCDSS